MAKAIKLLTREMIFTKAQSDDKQVCLSDSGDDDAQDLADFREALGLDDATTGYVDIDSAQTVTGAKTFSAAVVMGGNLTVDTTTLKVDASTNRVGIGTASPTSALHVVGTSLVTGTASFSNDLTVATSVLKVLSEDGYVGIGTATPSAPLDVVGKAELNGDVAFDKTITAAATVGAQTINKNAGSVNFDAAATSLVVTNSRVTANSVIIATVATNDATMTSVQAVAGSGSFTLYANAAATAETRVNFLVIN